jgi:hypothetical protein
LPECAILFLGYFIFIHLNFPTYRLDFLFNFLSYFFSCRLLVVPCFPLLTEKKSCHSFGVGDVPNIGKYPFKMAIPNHSIEAIPSHKTFLKGFGLSISSNNIAFCERYFVTSVP